MIHCSSVVVACRLRTMEGSATLRMVLSRLIRRSVTHRTDRVAQRHGPPVRLATNKAGALDRIAKLMCTTSAGARVRSVGSASCRCRRGQTRDDDFESSHRSERSPDLILPGGWLTEAAASGWHAVIDRGLD